MGVPCRPPRGGRGLKFGVGVSSLRAVSSPPSRGAWIEIFYMASSACFPSVSPPSRGAWIEMLRLRNILVNGAVAPLAGGVD